MSAPLDDRVTVGVNAAGQKALDALRTETPYFPEELDAYRFAIAYAIGQGLADRAVQVRGAETKFNVGTLDRDNRLRSLVQAASIDGADRPYALAEQLAHVGLLHLQSRLVDDQLTMQEVLAASEDEPADSAEEDAEADEPPTSGDGRVESTDQ